MWHFVSFVFFFFFFKIRSWNKLTRTWDFGKKKFDSWRKATESFSKHESLQYHIGCVADAEHFPAVSTSPTEFSVQNQIDKQRAKQIEANRKVIVPIIEAVTFCGRQEIALRGHRDSGKIVLGEEPESNEGNFRALLRFRAQGDDSLRSVLSNPGENNKYISPTIQNKIIDSCNSVLLAKIVNLVNEAKCFAVLANETADISGVEQVSLCVRYVDLKEMMLKEDFLQFVSTSDFTGKGISELILSSLTSFGIHLQYLRGQGYNGAADMSRRFNGVQAHVKTNYPTAIYIHCAAHFFNLVISKYCEVQDIRNCIGIIGKTHDFFIHPKRKAVLTNAIQEMDSDHHARTLKRNCATCWIERYHAVSDFCELLEPVVESLEQITHLQGSSDTSQQAAILKSAIQKSNFLISLMILKKVFSIGLPFSKYLQTKNIDLREAVDMAQLTLQEIQVLRNDAENHFHIIFEEAKTIADKNGVLLNLPRTTGRQNHRPNLQEYSASPENYFRITVFIPFLDTFLTELNSRIICHSSLLKGFHAIIPGAADIDFLQADSEEDIENFLVFITGI
ncbi:zinc finger MYM-type protein 1-like [Bacillus rossius redtenbacheri]|uniref:zinc finger MYM-type protein 1-like n=1 Tax=Bacillus rossius redtenbacheri TaxID=93214 RepID=UPI002FDC7FDF